MNSLLDPVTNLTVLLTELFHAKIKEYHERDWSHAPHFITPLKNHLVRRGHDCTMSCAFLGNPRPAITLYKGEVNITAHSKFWYNSTSGVCTLMIPTCTAKDSGEYSILIENELGKEKCSCTLTVYGKLSLLFGIDRRYWYYPIQFNMFSLRRKPVCCSS